MTQQPDRYQQLIAPWDELLATARIVRARLPQADQDNGDGAYEAISVMLLQVREFFGERPEVIAELFPMMSVVEHRIRRGNYVGAIWAIDDLRAALEEIRGLLLQRLEEEG